MINSNQCLNTAFMHPCICNMLWQSVLGKIITMVFHFMLNSSSCSQVYRRKILKHYAALVHKGSNRDNLSGVQCPGPLCLQSAVAFCAPPTVGLFCIQQVLPLISPAQQPSKWPRTLAPLLCIAIWVTNLATILCNIYITAYRCSPFSCLTDFCCSVCELMQGY